MTNLHYEDYQYLSKILNRNPMKELNERMKLEAQQIKGGDFENWYEGLSPIRKWLYGIWIGA
jgi:ubiquinone/menaquinone biosynthesis C-methylase UbiE|tara:strand:- start:259 stop:444 length:186 start_codon:yes stop_codon:yes gene_type:complete